MSSSGQHGTVGAGGRKCNFSGKRQIIASLSIAVASYGEKSGEFQIFLSVVKFSIQLPLQGPPKSLIIHSMNPILQHRIKRSTCRSCKMVRNNSPTLQKEL